jgi:hypothetical protein
VEVVFVQSVVASFSIAIDMPLSGLIEPMPLQLIVLMDEGGHGNQQVQITAQVIF